MLVENIIFADTFYVMVLTYLLGVISFLVFFLTIKKRNEHLSQFNNFGKLLKGALVGGLASSFLLTIIITTLTPTIVTIENGHVHSEGFSFFGNEGFLGFGGSYVVNNSNQTIKVIGIEEDKDINVVINPNTTEKIRKCPEEFFERTPTNDSRGTYRVTRSRKGRRKIIGGNTVFLYDAESNKTKDNYEQ